MNRHNRPMREARRPLSRPAWWPGQAIGGLSQAARQLGAGMRPAMLACALATGAASAATLLADGAISSAGGVPGNLALALSVEFPTAVSVAHTDSNYDATQTYLGYFDPAKCYLYEWSMNEAQRRFVPSGVAAANLCTGAQDTKWSGNFLNWATMQTIDPFRWVLTGGYRSTDTADTTVLEKAWASGQGGTSNFPNRQLDTSAEVTGATPFNGSALKLRIQGLGNKMRFTVSGSVDNSPTNYQQGQNIQNSKTYEVSVRVKVCDNSASAGPLEANCLPYPSGYYKPTGLIHQYAEQIRLSAFGYLNDSNLYRDGGVLRARQKFVGPNLVTASGATEPNAAREWDAQTGVFVTNPDPADATATANEFGTPIDNSGVINYLNKFGQITQSSYKVYDNVSELYYAALRYFKKQGNVPEWSSMTGASSSTRAAWADGFPVITQWDDPIQYSCQKNFILGIGDVNTHADRNLPGATGSREPSKPSAVSADNSVDATAATDKLGLLHGLGSGLGSTQGYNGCCNSNGALMAGLAYDANTTDIRPDDPADPLRTKGRQSVQTFWLDVLEYQRYKQNNQYYLATKYGSFDVPDGFDPYARSTDLSTSWWHTNGETVGGQPRPDAYFTAQRPDQVVAGLTRAFQNIAQRIRNYSSAFSTAQAQVGTTDVASYASVMDSRAWTGDLIASSNALDASSGAPTRQEAWRFAALLQTQAAGSGWSDKRVMATWNTTAGAAVALRLPALSTAQQTALDTAYRSGNDAADYLAYLRGDTTHERSSIAAGSARAYRDRSSLMGDIGNFRPRVVARPDAPYSESANPGYAAFKTARAGRPTMVYVGTQAGVLHAVDGAVDGSANAGRERFAYVPGALFSGPTGTPATNGLAALGNPDATHVNRLDATPVVADVDLGATVGGSARDWRTLLVGGLGKGGRALYALDVSAPEAITDEDTLAQRVMWEFTDPDLGYTYGEPAIVKTARYGWVVLVGSGYNNADGRGYLFIINPRNGSLLQKISTGEGSPSADAGLAHVQAFLLDRTDGKADSVYAGDLLGNLWRFDLSRADQAVPTPVRLALLQDKTGQPLPVTSRPLVVVQPQTMRRFVTVGTGRLLHASDLADPQGQRFFAIIDGTNAAFGGTAATPLPAGISYPLTTAQLRPLTDLQQKVVLDLASEQGWYLDLSTVAGEGWRITTDATSYFGIVAFSTMKPGEVVNPCEASDNNRIYAVDLGSAQTRLLASTALTAPVVPYVSALPGVITDLRFYSVSGKARLLAGSSTGQTGALAGNWGISAGLRRTNWREVNLVD
jgi:type IV pilus assembly protein PilY1